MGGKIKKLKLQRETVASLKLKSGLKTGATGTLTCEGVCPTVSCANTQACPGATSDDSRRGDPEN